MKERSLVKRLGRFSFVTTTLALLLEPTAFAGPPQCPQPTPQECMDPAWAETECGQQEKALADVDPNEICNTYVREGLVSYINQTYFQEPYTEEYTVVPDGMFGAGELRPTLVAPDRWAEDVDYYGFPSTYTDHLMRQKVAALNPQSWAATELRDYFAPWDNNGTAVSSCSEYVYEKWWEYSRFQDDAALLKSNYRAIYDRAKRTPDGIAWGPIKSKDGQPQREVQWPTGLVPKNAFFLFELTPFDRYPFDPSTLPNAAGAEYSTVDWSLFGLVDGALTMEGRPDAELYAMDKKQATFKKLLTRRAKLIAELELAAGSGMVMLSVLPKAFESPATELFISKQDFYSIPDTSALTAFTGGGIMLTPPPVTGGYSGKMGDLYAIDHQIQQLLFEARDRGCLDLYKASVCDWSPKQFVDYLGKQFVSEMESDFNRCVAATGDDFSPTSTIRTAQSHGIPGAWMEDFTGTTTDVTRFLDLYDTFVLAKDFTPAPGSVDEGATGWWKFGGSSAGSPSTLAGNYDWAIGFGVRKNSASPSPDCSAELSALAQFEAGVSVSNIPYTVVDFRTSIETQNDKLHAHSHLNIAGKDLYKPVDRDAGLSFSVLDLSDSAEMSVTGHAAIGFIPVVYTLGIVGEGGISIGFDATIGRACAGGGGTLNLVLAGHAVARVTGGAFAAGGVGVSGASVGMSGTLNLVDVSFKPTATMTVHNETPGDLGTLVADFTFDLPRRFATLSGNIKFYAELLGWAYTKTLAKWDGIVTEVNDAPPRPIHIPLYKVWSKI